MLTLASDLTVLFLALPTLGEELNPTASQSLWIVHVYGFLIAGFLITMGRLGDRVGSRRLMFVGATAFALLSVVAAFSSTPEMLIAARALLGIAGATLMPSLFSLLRTMFADETQRRTAIAIVFSAFSVGGAIGPLLGGALLEFFWWGSVFLVNVPPMVLLVVAGRRLLPERTAATAERNETGERGVGLDLRSVALSVAGMLAVVYAIQELAAGQEAGTGSVWPNLALVVAGAVALGLFVRRQRRLRDPLFDLALLRNRRIGASLAALLLTAIGVVGMFFLMTQYLQWVVGLTPLQAGVWTLPYVVLNVAGALLAPPLAGRMRPAVVVALGLAVTVAGAVLLYAALLVAGAGTSLPFVVAAISVVGLGQGMAMALTSDLIISSAPERDTGSAAAAQEVGGELGSALGIAAGGAVSMTIYRAALADTVPPDVPDADAAVATAGIPEGTLTAERLDSPELLGAVRDAVTLGMQAYTAAGALLVAVGGMLITVTLVLRDPGGRDDFPRDRES
ncbi:MFS transporter [Rhodococcus rhodnii]|nr:MFS transporter [Rhodococcus rhodnii]